MDLLGSILNSMDGPPKVDEKQKQLIKSKFTSLIFALKFQLHDHLQNKRNKKKMLASCPRTK